MGILSDKGVWEMLEESKGTTAKLEAELMASRARELDLKRKLDILESANNTPSNTGTSECRCVPINPGGGKEVDPRSCPEHAYEAGRLHERLCYLEEKHELEMRIKLRDMLDQMRTETHEKLPETGGDPSPWALDLAERKFLLYRLGPTHSRRVALLLDAARDKGSRDMAGLVAGQIEEHRQREGTLEEFCNIIKKFE